MKVQRSDSKHSTSEMCKFIWSSDGWVYNLSNQTRRKFFTTDKKDIFTLIEEKGVFVITDIQYEETIPYLKLSSKMWQEGSDTFCVIEEDS